LDGFFPALADLSVIDHNMVLACTRQSERSRVVAHWRAIVLLLILACVAFLVARSDEFGRFELTLLALFLVFIASQIFWIGRLVDVEQRVIPGGPRRLRLAIEYFDESVAQ
jgi:hypothetical protein